ncbi:MAG: hypothetical protein R2706_09790 [Acidimicrobiales bacterium]
MFLVEVARLNEVDLDPESVQYADVAQPTSIVPVDNLRTNDARVGAEHFFDHGRDGV